MCGLLPLFFRAGTTYNRIILGGMSGTLNLILIIIQSGPWLGEYSYTQLAEEWSLWCIEKSNARSTARYGAIPSSHGQPAISAPVDSRGCTNFSGSGVDLAIHGAALYQWSLAMCGASPHTLLHPIVISRKKGACQWYGLRVLMHPIRRSDWQLRHW